MIQLLRRLDSAIGPFINDGARIMFLMFAAVALLICLVYQLQAVSHPYSLDYGEAPLVDQAMRLAAGQNIYRADLSTAPYTISNYPPLYVAVVTTFVWLFGPAKAFLAGRMVSALSAWLAGMCIFLIVSKATRDRFAGFVAGAMLIAFPFVTYWSPLLRIDMFALALSLGGLTLLIDQPASAKRFAFAGLLLTAAIYTRQSYALATPLAAFVWLLGHNWKRAFGLAALVGGLALILFLTLNLLTQGGFFYNIVTANVNEFGMERLKYNVETFQRAALLPLLIGGLSLFLIWRWNPLWLLAAPYLIGATLSAATIGKIGSNVNYLLELCAALSLAAGVVIAWSRSRLNIQILRGLILIAAALGFAQMMHFTLNEITGDLRNRRADIDALRRLETLVVETPGPILADEHMAMLTMHGRPLMLQPFEVTQLSRAGQWDQTPLIESIRKNEFSTIIIYEPWSGERWTPEMRTAINQSYILAANIAENRVYLPRNRQTSTNMTTCPGAVWQLPAIASQGAQWREGRLRFYGHGQAGTIPVYAAADGLLFRQQDWFDRVAILHDDPLNPGAKTWTYYSGMGAANGLDSFVAPDFPPGLENAPVKAGQIVGYQGTWSGKPLWAAWVHVDFAVIPAMDQESAFPPEFSEADLLDPAPYFGLALRPPAETQNRQTIKCSQP